MRNLTLALIASALSIAASTESPNWDNDDHAKNLAETVGSEWDVQAVNKGNAEREGVRFTLHRANADYSGDRPSDEEKHLLILGLQLKLYEMGYETVKLSYGYRGNEPKRDKDGNIVMRNGRQVNQWVAWISVTAWRQARATQSEQTAAQTKALTEANAKIEALQAQMERDRIQSAYNTACIMAKLNGDDPPELPAELREPEPAVESETPPETEDDATF